MYPDCDLTFALASLHAVPERPA